MRINRMFDYMHELNIDDLFENKTKKEHVPKRTYDVKVTMKKNGTRRNGSTRYSIRFGLINKAADVFNKMEFIQMSSVVKCPYRIYFRQYDHKECLNVYKLRRNTDAATGLEFSITPDDKTEKIMRTIWVGKEFFLRYDDYNKMYFIETEGEDE